MTIVETETGRFRVGAQPIDRLALRAGGTPFFAYDRGAIDERVESLRRALPSEVELAYSIKANPWVPVVQHFARRVDGFDVSSAAELRTALNAGMAPDKITFAGPGKRDEELRLAVAVGAIVSVESAGELDRIERIGAEISIRPRVLLRVNPDFDLRGIGLRMGAAPCQFGVDRALCGPLLLQILQPQFEFLGYHVFWGSQCLDASVVVEAQAQTLSMVAELAEVAGRSPQIVNIGGGFGIPYTSADAPLDLATVGAGLTASLDDWARLMPHARVIVELGRYLIGEAGIYVTRCLEKKVSRGKTFLVTDGGMHHQLAASGHLGQMLRRNYPIEIVSQSGRTETETVDVTGCLCTTIDLLARNAVLPVVEPGDFIIVLQSGAYGLSSSPHEFLSHPRPLELLV